MQATILRMADEQKALQAGMVDLRNRFMKASTEANGATAALQADIARLSDQVRSATIQSTTEAAEKIAVQEQLEQAQQAVQQGRVDAELVRTLRVRVTQQGAHVRALQRRNTIQEAQLAHYALSDQFAEADAQAAVALPLPPPQI